MSPPPSVTCRPPARASGQGLPAPVSGTNVRFLAMAFPNPPAILSERDLRASELNDSPTNALLRIYAWMHLARTGDNRILELFRQGLIKGTVTGGQGHEALTIPLALLADKAVDVVSWTHRDFGGHLIWGGHLCE